MPDTNTELLNHLVGAYGGDARWSRLRSIAFRATTGGLALPARFQFRAFKSYRADIQFQPPEVVIYPHPRPGHAGRYTDGAVRIEDPDGRIHAERIHAREAFSDLRHHLWWDALDALHFAGYALWNYFCLPGLLRLPGVETEEIKPWEEGGEIWRRLRVKFPENILTHSTEQIYYLNENGLVRRHDYTAEVFGTWAKAAHYSDGHEQVAGLVFPTRRRVHPRKPDNRPRRWITLVSLDITEIRVDFDENTAGVV